MIEMTDSCPVFTGVQHEGQCRFLRLHPESQRIGVKESDISNVRIHNGAEMFNQCLVSSSLQVRTIAQI
jgi:hypothetical protein